MKKQAFLIVLMLFWVAVSPAHSMMFKNMVMFGDSLSDSGNFFALHGEYPPAPYYQGRFSDGPVWFEYLARDIGLTGLALNYSHGGAKTGDSNVNDNPEQSGTFPGFSDEVDAYLSAASLSAAYPGAFAMPGDSLFIIWIGANDFWTITDPQAQIAQAAANIQNEMLKLIQAGALKFVVISLPDLGKTPKFNGDPAVSVQATQLSMGYNQTLGQVVAGIRASFPDVSILEIDSFAILSEFIDNAGELGFSNTTDAKLNIREGRIADGGYLFWDDVHPTTMAHQLIAGRISDAIGCENCRVSAMPFFRDDLTFLVPSAQYRGVKYGFTLLPYSNPHENGSFWQLDPESVSIIPGF